MSMQVKFSRCLQQEKPLIAMIITQIAYVGMSLFSKAAISWGMKPPVFVAYRQAIATLVLAPFAFFYQRETCPPLTWAMFGKLYVVSTCGIALSLNLFYTALNYASATFATSFTNIIPAMVFVIAVTIRMENLAMSEWYGRAKVFGTVVGLSGAMAFTFYKGPPIHSSGNSNENHRVPKSDTKTYTREEWIIGSILLFTSNAAWAMWLIMQVPILKQYPAKLRATTIQFGCSCLSTAIYGAIVHRDLDSWKIGWDLNLLAVAYSGIAGTGISHTLQIWVVNKKGPVYTSSFSPLSLVLTAIFSALLLGETLHWGSGLGASLLIIGLYSFLWGKNRETKISDGQKASDLESTITSKPPGPAVHEDKQTDQQA